jgi:hypothetical protein
LGFSQFGLKNAIGWRLGVRKHGGLLTGAVLEPKGALLAFAGSVFGNGAETSFQNLEGFWKFGGPCNTLEECPELIATKGETWPGWRF